MTGAELGFIQEAHASGHLSGDGTLTRRCQEWFEKQTGSAKVLLTHSCTGALEMAAILAEVGPGDEIILPSYTFVSTANAFVLRGATPVFVDIRPDTLNLDENRIEAAVTRRTKAIVPVHYGGVSCEMDTILKIAKKHRLFVIEDAAQGVNCKYRGRPLGSLGELATFSFHETKNIISGEGGALLVNDESLIDRAQVIWQKGTNRTKFTQGYVDKYTWVDIGSSFLPSELIAAFLWGQIQEIDAITEVRLAKWKYYHERFAELESRGYVRRPQIPEYCEHNAHLYYLLVPAAHRTEILNELKKCEIGAVFHYVPLHSSPAGAKYGRVSGSMTFTDELSAQLIRLPLWVGLTGVEQDRVVQAVQESLVKVGIIPRTRGILRA